MSRHRRIDFIVQPNKAPLSGSISIPGDKSISHRALMLGAIAEGETCISGILESEDILATKNAFTGMGVRIEQSGAGTYLVHGAGLHGLLAPLKPLDLGNSGTSARLLAGLLAGQTFDSELTGDASLLQRPMRRITGPLASMGAGIHCSSTGTLPITIAGGRQLQGISYVMPVASAQLKSSLLLAGLYASGTTCIEEPAITRDHTERLLTYFDCPVERSGRRICIQSRPLHGKPVEIPGDISSAAFFMVAASIVEGSELLLKKVGLNPTRHAVIAILQAMGANINVHETAHYAGEPVGDVLIKFSRLRGITIPAELVPIAIDELPVILIAAAFARGCTVLGGAAELRVKESDRIQAMADGLAKIGVDAVPDADGMRINGGRPHGGEIHSYGDHRIAMAFAVAGMAAQGPVRIKDCVNVNTSFPDFVQTACKAGAMLNAEETNAG